MKSPPWMRALPLIALMIASMAAFAPGCSSDGGKDNPGKGGSGGSGGTDGAGGTGGDTGCTSDAECPDLQACVEGACTRIVCTDDRPCGDDGYCPDVPAPGETERYCVPKCIIDADCGFDTGRYCDDNPSSDAFGRCVPAEKCVDDRNCGTAAGFDYCEEPGDCVCIPDASVADGSVTGICRRTTPTCSPCVSDADCGTNPFFHEDPARCVPYNVDGETVNVCLPIRDAGSCPAGTIYGPGEEGADPMLAEFCVPQSLDCADMNPCKSDDDCKDNPAAPICDMSRQICIAACRFDFQEEKSIGCPPTEVCHAMPSGLDPDFLAECSTVAFFGQGKCGDACTTDAECAVYDGGTGSFICDPDENRCRPKSAADPTTTACLDDRECPEVAGGIFLGFCDMKADPTQNECVYDTCRPGLDPRAGCGSSTQYGDCGPLYKCVEGDLGEGECLPKDCIDKGGASLACRKGQFCAGEPMRDINTGEEVGSPRPKPSNVPDGECYDMETPVWCEAGCGSHAECANPPSGAPRHSDSPSLCIQNGDGVARCNWGCQYNAECPGHWFCSSDGLELNCGIDHGAGTGLQVCDSDADCGGNNRCVEPTVKGRKFTNWGTMAPFKVCECSDTNSCGGGYECNAGLGTAGQDADDAETYQVRQARYCAAKNICGNGGSCEWFGTNFQIEEDAPNVPFFRCGATPENSIFPGGGEDPEVVECPSTDAEGTPIRRGTFGYDQYHCVYSSVCQPEFVREGDALVCKTEPAPAP